MSVCALPGRKRHLRTRPIYTAGVRLDAIRISSFSPPRYYYYFFLHLPPPLPTPPPAPSPAIFSPCSVPRRSCKYREAPEG